MTSGPRYLLSLLCVLAAITVPLLVAGLGADGTDSRAAPPGASPARVVAELPRIARGVAQVRELRFDRPPRPRVVDLAQLQHIFAAEQRKHQDSTGDEADLAALTLLGLVPARIDLEKLATAIAAETAGAYDPRTGRLFILRDSSLANAALIEFILSHELDHALEDQRYGLPDLEGLSDDRGLAEQALIEGTATEVMILYAAQFMDLAELLDATNDPSLLQSPGSGRIPDLIEAEQTFTYLRGRNFVDSLRKLSGGWNLINIAFGSRPPLSTAQVMHPFKYLTYERPVQVRLRAGRVLRAPWRRLGAIDLGEFDSFQMLRSAAGSGAAHRAAAGWAGQRFEIWRRGQAPCRLPCRSRDAIVGTWAWEAVSDRRQFDRALRLYLRRGLGAKPARGGSGLWTLKGGSVVIASAARSTTVSFAPRPRLAGRLAERG